MYKYHAKILDVSQDQCLKFKGVCEWLRIGTQHTHTPTAYSNAGCRSTLHPAHNVLGTLPTYLLPKYYGQRYNRGARSSCGHAAKWQTLDLLDLARSSLNLKFSTLYTMFFPTPF